MDYEEFARTVKAMGVNDLWREIDHNYTDMGELHQLYAVLNKQLIGSYSNAIGGTILKKPSRAWNASGRKFEKTKI